MFLTYVNCIMSGGNKPFKFNIDICRKRLGEINSWKFLSVDIKLLLL